MAGSTSTKQNTYTDSTGGVANTNPIVLDANGFPTNTQIWFTAGQSYKVVYAPAGDTDPPSSPIWTIDNLRGQNDTTSSVDQWVSSGITPTYVSGTSFTMAGDQTTAFHVGRRLKLTVTAGTVYGTIATSVFGALTTVTMTMDGAGVLDSGLSAVSLGLLTATSVSIPNFITAGTGITVTYSSGKPTIATSGSGGVPFMPLTAAVATNALTFTLASGTVLNFNDGTSVTLGSAITVTASSGSTLGTVSGQRSRIWCVALKNSGTPELAIMNALSGVNIASIPVGGTISTTAEGGAGAADSAQVWYSTTARSSQPFCVVGYVESTQATAGTWASAPTAQGYGPGISLPGAVVQNVGNATGAVATGTTTVPFDDTIPQNTEGDQYLSQAATPTSAANILQIEAVAYFENSAGTTNSTALALFQDSTANALAVGTIQTTAAQIMQAARVFHKMVAATTSSTTLKARGGNASAGTTTFNGQSAGRKYGGVANSYIYVTEIQT